MPLHTPHGFLINMDLVGVMLVHAQEWVHGSLLIIKVERVIHFGHQYSGLWEKLAMESTSAGSGGENLGLTSIPDFE